MQNTIIPDGLELVTDPNITRLFPSSVRNHEQQTFSFMPKKTKPVSFYSKDREQLGILTRLKRINFAVFDEDGNVNPQPRCE